MRRLALCLLGAFEATLDGKPLTGFRTDKARTLLIYLAVERSRAHRREQLATLFWPDWPDASARAYLRNALSNLRHVIGDDAASPPFLSVTQETIQFNRDTDYFLDTAEFERVASDRNATIDQLQSVIERYRGPFLEGFTLKDCPAFDDWSYAVKERLQVQVSATLNRLAELYEQAKEYEKAIGCVRKRLTLEPWQEDAHRQLMRLLAADGQRTAALAQFEACKRSLKAELDVEPSAETIRLFESIRDSIPAEPVLAKAHPHNLPAQLTSFIGREKEITIIIDFFKIHRLVTLTGVGGTGKTRLSLEVAAAMLELFPDGVWLVELASLADPSIVVETVARSLGMQLASSSQALSFLEDYLQDKKMLLILDNCEHLIQACAQLAHAILQTCPFLVILASSREALGIEGELTYRVPPLPFPKTEELPSLADDVHPQKLEQFAAIRLFVERARNVLPDFQITLENALGLAQICHHLDGIPLAIELAAARLKLLNVEEVARRLDDRFRLLVGGSRAALPRYQTLRASLDWSYELLSPRERTLFQRLSTFAGGWFLEAAEHVGCGEGADGKHPIDSCDVLDLLGGLVNKSLVFVEAGTGSETRYNMLETIRQYAYEKLVESDQEKLVRNRHLQYYLDLAEKTGSRLRGPEQHLYLELLEAELDNIRLALEWSLKNTDQPDGNPESGMRIASALRWFWHARGRHEEGLQWLERLLCADAEKHKVASPYSEKLLSPSNTKVRAWALLVAGCEAQESRLGDPNKIAQFLEESRNLFLNLGPEGRLGYADVLYTLSEGVNDFETRKRLAEESLQIFKEEKDQFGMGQSYASMGEAAIFHYKYEKAKGYIENQLACYQSIDDRDGVAYAYQLLGHVEFNMGDLEKARVLLEQSCQILSEIQNDFFQEPWVDLGILDWVEGDYAQAAQKFQQVLSTGQRLGSAHWIFMGLINLGSLALSRGDFNQAAKYYEENLKFQRKKGNKNFIAALLRSLGNLAWAEGDAERAIANYLEAQEIYREAGSQYLESEILIRLARCAFDLGNFQKARLNLVHFLEKPFDRDPLEYSVIFEIIAYLELTSNNFEKSAQLLGYTQDVYSRNQRRLSPRAREMREQAIDSLKQAIGEEAFSAAWEEGKKMTLEQAMEYALGESV